MDWAGWALFGLVATTTLTAVMITAQLAGLTRLDLLLALGTLVTPTPTPTPTAPGSLDSSSTSPLGGPSRSDTRPRSLSCAVPPGG